MSALKDPGRWEESSGLTSRIQRPETSVKWSAHCSRSLIDVLRLERATWMTPFGSPNNSESSSNDIERPAPKSMASKTMGKSGSDSLNPPEIGLWVELFG